MASGGSIAEGGPGFSQVAYCLIGTMVYCFMSSLGEMATYLPISGSLNAYGTRFFDPALGFTLGKDSLVNQSAVRYETETSLMGRNQDMFASPIDRLVVFQTHVSSPF